MTNIQTSNIATPLITNFDLLMARPNFERDVIDTYEDLISVDREGEYAKGHIVYCKDKDSYYSYTDVYTAEMGFFKHLSLGGRLDFVEADSDVEYDDLGVDLGGSEDDSEDDSEEPVDPEEPNEPDTPEGGEDGGEDGGDGTEDGGEDTDGNENNGEDNGEGTEEPTEPIT